MIYLYALYCSVSALSCDMVVQDISVQDHYRDYEACEMAIPFAAESYPHSPGISIRFSCDHRDIRDVLDELKRTEKIA